MNETNYDDATFELLFNLLGYNNSEGLYVFSDELFNFLL